MHRTLSLMLVLIADGCFSPLVLDVAREEVAPLGVRRDGWKGPIDGVVVDVKNVDGLADGTWLIPMAKGGSAIAGPLELVRESASFRGANAMAGFTAPPADDLGSFTPVNWLGGDEVPREIREHKQYVELLGLRDVREPFALRADVRRDADRRYTIELLRDDDRSGHWRSLGVVAVGRGDQSDARWFAVGPAMFVSVPVDVVLAAGGTLILGGMLFLSAVFPY